MSTGCTNGGMLSDQVCTCISFVTAILLKREKTVTSVFAELSDIAADLCAKEHMSWSNSCARGASYSTIRKYKLLKPHLKKLQDNFNITPPKNTFLASPSHFRKHAQLIRFVRLINTPNCLLTPCMEFVLQPVEGALDSPDPLPLS